MDPKTQATSAAPEVKFYLAKAIERSPEQGKAPQETTFVVAGPDYKTAWQSARHLTAVGHAHFKGEAFVDQTRSAPMEMIPAFFTVKEVVSLQQRSKKIDPITIDALEAEMQKQGKTLPKNVQEVINKLRADGPLAGAGAGEAEQPTTAEGDQDDTRATA